MAQKIVLTKEQHKTLTEMARRGETWVAIGREIGCAADTIARYAKRHGITRPAMCSAAERHWQRKTEIIALWNDGKSAGQIGAEIRMCRKSVESVVKRARALGMDVRRGKNPGGAPKGTICKAHDKRTPCEARITVNGVRITVAADTGHEAIAFAARLAGSVTALREGRA